MMKHFHTKKFKHLADPFRILWVLAVFGCLFSLEVLIGSLAMAQQTDSIWTPDSKTAAAGTSAGECHFRRKFTTVEPVLAEMEIGGSGSIEIFINDKLVHRSSANTSTIKLDVSRYLQPGVNLIAAKARHAVSQPLGFSGKLRVLESGESRFRVLVTDTTWKTSSNAADGWHTVAFNDDGWHQAISTASTSRPATAQQASTQSRQGSSQTRQEETDPNESKRFQIDPEFIVEEILTPEETGSLIAMEFDEFGRLLLSREGGPLLIADPNRPANDPARVKVYCDQVNTCQGILALNGQVYVTAMGPEGLGLYQLKDIDRNSEIDTVKKIVGFTGGLGEHGPHGVQLGPDGLIYVILGNGTQVEGDVAANSPYRHWYEGDLVPRYEDPGGHAVGVKAPGGTIIRMELDGSNIERFAGGIRNAYDLVFDERGDLLIHDSDMESDYDAPWYRPNNVYFVPAGAELGWRSGWSNFPIHAIDQTPPLCGTGRGSPTGAVLYQHLHFPARYHDTVFLADWSEGRILALYKQPTGAGYSAITDVFMSGKPLNVCDLAVGEDGALYFCAGGRGTSGGVFRISWTGTVPDAMLEFNSELAKVVRHPQPNSAWARQNIAAIAKNLGDKWSSSMEGVVKEARNPARFRMRALQLMVLYGPTPSDDLLTQLASDSEPDIRSETARLCGLNRTEVGMELLEKLMADSDPRVRRCAGEAFLRTGANPRLESLKPLLSTNDRIESAVGRRLLERIPAAEWENELLNTENTRLFINSSMALMTSEPTLERAYIILARCSATLEGFVSDLDFLDLLRVTQLALIQGKVEAAKVPGLVERIGEEFPSGNSIINQELAKIMAYLKIGTLDGRIETYLKSSQHDLNERLHVAMYLQFVGDPLQPGTRLALIAAMESGRSPETSPGLRMYLKRAVEDAAKTLTPEQVEIVLANGVQWPDAVIPAFYQLPEKLDPKMIDRVIALDKALKQSDEASADQLRLGVIAVLARSGDPTSMDYLRKLWIDEESRRNEIAIGLAEQPAAENWPYLVTSLPALDDLTGREIVQKLLDVDRRPVEPKHYWELIRLGYRMRNAGAIDATRLLERWTGETLEQASFDWKSRLDIWKNWFEKTYTEFPPIVTMAEKKSGRHTIDGLTDYLETAGLGDRMRGQHLFASTQCATCHRHGATGQNVGPDLSNLAQRFSIREVIEATLDPSAHIPDRYRSKVILTIDGDQHTGMAVAQPEGGYLVLRSDGQRIRVAQDEIDAIKDSPVSAMPEGLLDPLSPSEVADLAAFLMNQNERIAGNPSETR